MHDVVVIGAGVGGLAAAIRLAAGGQRVLVLEAASAAGGKAGIVEVDGVEIDTGPSVLTMPHVFDEVLALAGMTLESEAPLQAPRPFMRYRWPDDTALDVHHDARDTIAAAATALGADAASDLEGFLRYAAEIWSIAAPRFVLGDAPTIGDLLRLGISGLREASRLDAWTTMWAAIRARVRSPHLRDVLARYATYNGSDPRRAPATLNCIAHVELGMGAVGVAGGVYALVRALERAAARLGVSIRFQAPVARILLDHHGVTGVGLADGSVVPARAVVANADVGQIVSSLLPNGLKSGLAVLHDPSTSGYCLALRARRQRAPRPAHLVLFPQHYMDEFADVFDRDRPPANPTVYVCAQEVAHGRRGWPDHEALFVMVNAPAEPMRGERDPAIWPHLERRLLARLSQAGVIESGDEVVWRRSPADLARRFPGSRGALYGAASHSWNAAFKRPANQVERVPGLFLASGSAHPGGGLPLAALSGKAAARSAQAHLSNTHGLRRNA